MEWSFNKEIYIVNSSKIIHIETEVDEEHLILYIKYSHYSESSFILNTISSRLNSEVRYIELHFVDELRQGTLLNLKQNRTKLSSNITRLSIYIEAIANKVDKFTIFLNELLNDFACLNFKELIFNGVSDKFIKWMFANTGRNVLSDLRLLRIEEPRLVWDKTDLDIEVNLDKMVFFHY